MKRFVAFLSYLFVYALCVHAPSAWADSVLYTGVGDFHNESGLTLGFKFTPSVDLTVNSLGIHDGGVDGPGLQVPHAVGLYNSSGALLASVTVDNTGTLVNGFRFASISPVVLNAAVSYVVAAYYPAGMTGDKGIPLVVYPYPLATLDRLLGEAGPALAFPTVQFPPNEFLMTANMLFTPNSGQTGDGDLNFDGRVDAADIMLATRIVIGSLVPTTNQLVAGDVAPRTGGQSQPDNQITLSDLLLIMRASLGLITL